MSDVNKVESGEKRSLEWKSFLFITVVLFPILSVASWVDMDLSCGCCRCSCLVLQVCTAVSNHLHFYC